MPSSTQTLQHPSRIRHNNHSRGPTFHGLTSHAIHPLLPSFHHFIVFSFLCSFVCFFPFNDTIHVSESRSTPCDSPSSSPGAAHVDPVDGYGGAQRLWSPDRSWRSRRAKRSQFCSPVSRVDWTANLSLDHTCSQSIIPLFRTHTHNTEKQMKRLPRGDRLPMLAGSITRSFHEKTTWPV